MRERTKSGKFRKGISGNPQGRPKSQHAAIREMLADGKDSVIAAVLAAANKGDMQAAKIVLDRLLPAYRPTAPTINLHLEPGASPLQTAQDILDAATAGQLPPDLAAQLVTAIGTLCRIEDTEELRDRIRALEKATLSEINKL